MAGSAFWLSIMFWPCTLLTVFEHGMTSWASISVLYAIHYTLSFHELSPAVKTRSLNLLQFFYHASFVDTVIVMDKMHGGSASFGRLSKCIGSLSRRLCWYRIMLWESETCPYLAVVCNNSSDRELISLLALRHSSSAKRTKRWSMQSIYPINFHGQESRSGVLPKIQVRMRTLITAISSINSLIRHHEIT